ncbi:MAG: Clp protease N-terminal domain-containing protein, partial [Acidimicrobiales bacterium]
MFERFTPRARRVVVLARQLVQEMGHIEIRPEHLLLGLAVEGEGLAAQAMTQAGVAVEALRRRVVERLANEVVAADVITPPFTTAAKKCLELSLREALSLGHNYIGTEHIFMGVKKEAELDGWSPSLESLLGVNPREVVQRSLDMLGSVSGTRMTPPGSPAFKSAMDRVQRIGGASTMTTGHMLEAFVNGQVAVPTGGQQKVPTSRLLCSAPCGPG